MSIDPKAPTTDHGLRPLHVGKFAPPPFAGIESHIDTLLRSLPPEVASTLVACEPVAPSPVRREPTPYRLITCKSYGTLASVALSPGLSRVVKREFAEGRANLLHVHAPNPWGDLAALDSARGTPVVMTWHSDVVRKPALMALYGGFQRRAVQRADKVVVFTPKHFESSQQLRVAHIESKLVHIPIGIDFDRLDQQPPRADVLHQIDEWAQGRPVFLSVGRQVYYKGYRHLIEAMSMIRRDAVLLMIGTGPLGESLRKQVRDAGLGERIRFLGEVDIAMLATALRRCDVFCLPSIEQSEAFGIATAEAMAFGKPTIVCELNNGVNFLNRKDETSVVTAPRDERALADAIDLLAGDTALRLRMGQSARSWVRSQFSVEAMREATMALYRTLV
jgi:glycosyltransferase involved in cell wall biosynthesis